MNFFKFEYVVKISTVNLFSYHGALILKDYSFSGIAKSPKAAKEIAMNKFYAWDAAHNFPLFSLTVKKIWKDEKIIVDKVLSGDVWWVRNYKEKNSL